MAQTNILLESGTNELELVEFYIDEEAAGSEPYRGHYGVNVAKVLEIIRLPSVTKLPGHLHPALIGTFNLRHKVIPLVDLAKWLGKTMAPGEEPKVVVSEFNRITTAFKVSGVTRIHRLSWSEIEPPDANITAFSNDSITGVVRFPDRILLIIDMEKILADLNPALSMKLDPAEVKKAPLQKEFKALIADDSASIRRMIASMMAKAGFTVAQCHNGKEAFDVLAGYKDQAQAQGRPVTDYVDVVVSDIEMPVMDGHNLTKRIKDDPVLRQLPVILFSSLITERLRHKGESVGADEQVSKPDIGRMTQRAYELIEERQGPLARPAQAEAS